MASMFVGRNLYPAYLAIVSLLNLKVACHGEGSLGNVCWGGRNVRGNDRSVSIYERNPMIYKDIGVRCLNRTECMYSQDTFLRSFDVVRASFNFFYWHWMDVCKLAR